MLKILLMADAKDGAGSGDKSTAPALVKIRIRKLIDEIGKDGKPNGKTRNAAQPIVLSPTWDKHLKGLSLPPRFEVGETYEVPELLAKSLALDVEILTN